MRIYLTVFMLIAMLNNVVYAATSADQLKLILPRIINGLAWIGYAISFGMFIYIGIKYMLSAASEKAALKEGSISFVVGGILIASASFVANIIAVFAAGRTNLAPGGLASNLISAAIDAASK